MNRQLAKQYFERAEATLEAGNPEEALALLNQLDEAFPNTKNIGVARARAYAAMGGVSEAVHLCDQLIVLHDSRRAREIKERLLQGVLEPGVARPAVAASGRRPLRRIVNVAVLSIVGVSVIAAAYWYSQQLESTVVVEKESARAPAIRASRPGLTQQSAGPTPGQEHLPFTWELDELGVPKWKSGIFRRVPCLNQNERTINVYLPLAYDRKPNAQFPGVLISAPGGNPNFLGLEAWAERQEVILIGLNSSRNGPSSNNIDAQEAAFETIMPTMRVDQRLGFAIGMSGAAMASWLAASRYPENFQGLVMMGQGGYEDRMLAPHIRVAYIRGHDEPNNWYIPRVIGKLRANGNQVRDQLVPGGHVMGPLEVRVEVLNWMVHAARRDLGVLQPSG